MQRVLTMEIGAHVGERVRMAGWLHTLRRLGGINFLVLRDVRGTAQVVIDRRKRWPRWRGCCPRRCWSSRATVVAEPQAPGGIRAPRPGHRGAVAGARRACRWL